MIVFKTPRMIVFRIPLIFSKSIKKQFSQPKRSVSESQFLRYPKSSDFPETLINENETVKKLQQLSAFSRNSVNICSENRITINQT